jgi:hypothetical protein
MNAERLVRERNKAASARCRVGENKRKTGIPTASHNVGSRLRRGVTRRAAQGANFGAELLQSQLPDTALFACVERFRTARLLFLEGLAPPYQIKSEVDDHETDYPRELACSDGSPANPNRP